MNQHSHRLVRAAEETQKSIRGDQIKWIEKQPHNVTLVSFLFLPVLTHYCPHHLAQSPFFFNLCPGGWLVSVLAC